MLMYCKIILYIINNSKSGIISLTGMGDKVMSELRVNEKFKAGKFRLEAIYKWDGYENIITAEFETRIEAESFLEDYMDKMGWKIKIWEVT